MKTQTIKGIIIGSIDYKESSKIVYLLTRYGKISVKALGSKNIKKGLLPFITTMNYVEAIITESDFPTLIDYAVIDTFDQIKNDLKKQLWFSYIFEIISKLSQDANYERIFDFVLNIINFGINNDGFLTAMIFQVKILYAFGVQPVLKKCVVCGNNPHYFSIKNGGAICNNHYNNSCESNHIYNMIYDFYYFDIKNGNLEILKKYDLNLLFKIITIYYNDHVNINLKGINSLIF